MSNTLFIGKVYHRFDELLSTNDYARDLLAKSKPPEGTVVRAASQSAGRGQYGSRWVSAPGQNLLLSIILYPTWLSAAEQWLLSEAVAVALREAGDGGRWTGDGTPSTIKWPNDLYIGTRKAAGILIQNTLNGSFLQASIVGIGLNVNQLDFPIEAPNATSMARAFGQSFDLEAVAEVLFACVERRYLQLKNGGSEAIRSAYRQHLLGLGEERTFARPDGSRFTGIIQDVARNGRLLVRTESGAEAFGVKEVALVQNKEDDER